MALSKPSYPVASGDYVICEEGDKRFSAHLGTCIGVALIDRKNRVSGLAHFLLAKPVGTIPVAQEMFYASSGLPLFIEELIKKGAEKEHLEAVIAGGALIGPVSRVDMDLNVGGQTSELVHKYLTAHDIKITRSETGGASGCQLTIDCSKLKTKISYFEDAHTGKYVKPSKMTKEEIGKAIASVAPIPQVLLKIINKLQDSDYTMKEIATDLKQEQVLAGRVLTLCNSAFFPTRKKISSIDTALVMIGEKNFLQMLLSASLEPFFILQPKGYSLVKGGLFFHSLGTAIVADKLAQFMGGVNPGIAYTAGLLHDIGKVVLDQFIGGIFKDFYRALADPKINLPSFEKETLGYSHCEIGTQLADAWDLPDELKDVIAFHHRPSNSKIAPKLTSIVYFADLLMSKFKVGLELDRIDTSHVYTALENMGIQSGQLSTIIEYIQWSDMGELLKYDMESSAI